MRIASQYFLSRLIGWTVEPSAHPRVMTFHGIEPAENCGLGELPAEAFAEFIQFLHRTGYSTLTMQQLVGDWHDSISRKHLVVLTFDDGYLNQWEVACPILKQYGMAATFFVTTDLISATPSKRAVPFWGRRTEKSFLGWNQIRQMSENGFEIGSHGASHSLVGSQPLELMRREIEGSKTKLESTLGTRIVSFAYAFGQRDAFSATSRNIVQQAGYLCACTQTGGPVLQGTDRFEVPRTDINPLDRLAMFKMKLDGYYDFWYRLRQI